MNKLNKVFQKCLSIFLVAVVFISLLNTMSIKAEGTVAQTPDRSEDYEDLFKDGEYEISTVTQIDALETSIIGNHLAFNLSFTGKEVSAEGDLYKLQGAALYSNAAVADITKASCTILFSALSRGQLIVYNHNTPEEAKFEGNMMLTCIVRWDETKEIFIVKALLDEESAEKASKNLDSMIAIDLDNPMFEKLLLTGDWYSIYVKENRLTLGQVNSVTKSINDTPIEKAYASSAEELTKIDHLKMYGIYDYFDETKNGCKEGFYSIPVTNDDGYVTYFSICDLKLIDGQYVGFIAIHDVKIDFIPLEGTSKRIDYKIQRMHNYFVQRKPGATLKESDITECDNNSTYVITQNPGFGIRITGGNTRGYFDTVKFQKNAGGGKVTEPSDLADTVLKTILGALCSELGYVITATDIFAEGLEALDNWYIRDTTFKFDTENSLFTKAIATTLPAQLYKKNSELLLAAELINLKTSSSSAIDFEYTVEVVGSRNAKPNKTLTAGFHSSKPLK